MCTKAPFFEHNRKLIATVEALEHKARRQDVLVDEAEIFAFYDALSRMASAMARNSKNGAGRRSGITRACFILPREYLMRHEADRFTEEQFSRQHGCGWYRAAGRDCVAACLSLRSGTSAGRCYGYRAVAAAQQAGYCAIRQLVPGLIREKITWYLKALPKQIRRHVVPIPEFVTQFLESQESSVSAPRTPLPMPLTEIFSRFIRPKPGLLFHRICGKTKNRHYIC